MKNYTLRFLSEVLRSVYCRWCWKILKIHSRTGWIRNSSQSDKRSFAALNFCCSFFLIKISINNLLTWWNVISTVVTLPLRWFIANQYLLFLLGSKSTVFDFIVYYFFLNLPFYLVSHQSSSIYQQFVSNLIRIFSAEQKLSIFGVGPFKELETPKKRKLVM